MRQMHDDGSELEVTAGDAYYFAPGHDGWVVGDETVIAYEIMDSGKDFGPWKTAGQFLTHWAFVAITQFQPSFINKERDSDEKLHGNSHIKVRRSNGCILSSS